MSATLRTELRVFRILSDLQSGTREVVDAEFARELAKEVDQLRGALALGQENCNAEYDIMREQRDRWQRCAEKLAGFVQTLTFYNPKEPEVLIEFKKLKEEP